MNDTIFNNIQFYDNSITKDAVVEAAKIANIYDFIQKNKDGFGAQVGERGLAISGGQRQRIALARVLARKPDVLVLDEATSALDNESESMIQKSIERLRGNITLIVIAHRLQTIMNSDKLVLLENGRAVEMGAPQELLKNKDSHFSKLYNLRN